MAVDKTSMSPSEWELMRIVWTENHASSREIIDQISAKRDWSESTIKTLLARLVKKGLLKTKKIKRSFIYYPQIAETSAMTASADQLFDHLCGMKKGAVLKDLITKTTLSKADIQALQAELAAKLPQAPEQVACDCLPKGVSGQDEFCD